LSKKVKVQISLYGEGTKYYHIRRSEDDKRHNIMRFDSLLQEYTTLLNKLDGNVSVKLGDNIPKKNREILENITEWYFAAHSK